MSRGCWAEAIIIGDSDRSRVALASTCLRTVWSVARGRDRRPSENECQIACGIAIPWLLRALLFWQCDVRWSRGSVDRRCVLTSQQSQLTASALACVSIRSTQDSNFRSSSSSNNNGQSAQPNAEYGRAWREFLGRAKILEVRACVMPGSRSSADQEHKSPRESGEDSEDESEILEESPCGRWLKRREEVRHPFAELTSIESTGVSKHWHWPSPDSYFSSLGPEHPTFLQFRQLFNITSRLDSLTTPFLHFYTSFLIPSSHAFNNISSQKQSLPPTFIQHSTFVYSTIIPLFSTVYLFVFIFTNQSNCH